MKVISLALSLTLILSMMCLMSFLLSMKSKMNRTKSSPFECGFSQMSSPRLPFSIHFFLIAMIFLIFDTELALMLPIPMTYKLTETKSWIFTSSTLLMLINFSLYHEWMNSMLEWSK